MLADAGVVVVVEPADAAVELEPGADDPAPVTGVDGALTANWVPVTTVTSAPSAIWLGAYPITTDPVIESATSSAAASAAGAREP